MHNSLETARRLSIAPMIDVTNRPYRYLLRLISNSPLLYTEMITAMALLHSKDPEHLLGFDSLEHPVACQLGGNSAKLLYKASQLVEKFGYDEVNLNVGCPSHRVQSGAFGAALMREPLLVSDCLKAMQDAVSIPVTLKCRIGVDDTDGYDYFSEFIDLVSRSSGINIIIVHARKAWLSGLSPKENRTIPPLKYDYVVRLKDAFQHLTIVLNGGLIDYDCYEKFPMLDGMMFGRKAMDDPFFFHNNPFINNDCLSTRSAVALKYSVYLEKSIQENLFPLSIGLKPLLGLYYGTAKGRYWRRMLSTKVIHSDTPFQALKNIIDEMNKA